VRDAIERCEQFDDKLQGIVNRLNQVSFVDRPVVEGFRRAVKKQLSVVSGNASANVFIEGVTEQGALLELLGISYKDLSRVDRIGVGASLTELQDGKVDAVAALLMSPSSSITETMLNTDIRLLSFTGDELAVLAGSAPWLQPAVIPAGTYKGLDKDVNALCVPCALWVRSELPYDLVYDMTRTLYENIDLLKEINVSYNGWTLLPQDGSDEWLHAAAHDFYDTLGR